MNTICIIAGVCLILFQHTVLACEMKIPVVSETKSKELTLNETTPLDEIVYEFKSNKAPVVQGSSSSFSIQDRGSNNYGLKLIKVLVWKPDDKVEKVNLLCTGEKVDRAKIIILIKDVDNNPPKFKLPSYTLEMPENEATTNKQLTAIQDLKVKDTDDPANQKINFTIVSGIYNSSYFKIKNPDTQLITLIIVKDLDYDVSPQYKVMIKAMDTDLTTNELKFEVNTTVTINLKDVNDLPPVFNIPDASKYTATITSNYTKGAIIKTEPEVLKAVDGDRSLNSSIIYRLQESTELGGLFAINNLTGEITLEKSQPDTGVKTLFIQAYDTSDKMAQATVTITILPAINLPPKFTEEVYTKSIYENINKGDIIIRVEAKDQITKPLTYKVLDHGDLFTMDTEPGHEGNVLLIGELDYEKTKNYVVKISASDGAFTVYTTLKIDVVNVNDNNPIFVNTTTSGEYKFKTERKKGIQVGQIKAYDKDGDTIIYSLNDNKEYFSINSNNGTIYITATKDKLTQSKYEITVQAEDNNVSPRKSNIKVVVEFTDAKPPVASASLEIWPFIIIGVILLLILLFAILAMVCYRKRSKDRMGRTFTDGRASSIYSYDRAGATSLAENPIEGYANDFAYGEDDYLDLGIYRADRDVSEIHLSETYPDANDYSTTNGSIRTVSGTSSFAGSRTNLLPNGNSLPKKMRLQNNLEVVQADNAIEAASVVDSTTGTGAGLTVYF